MVCEKVEANPDSVLDDSGVGNCDSLVAKSKRDLAECDYVCTEFTRDTPVEIWFS